MTHLLDERIGDRLFQNRFFALAAAELPTDERLSRAVILIHQIDVLDHPEHDLAIVLVDGPQSECAEPAGDVTAAKPFLLFFDACKPPRLNQFHWSLLVCRLLHVYLVRDSGSLEPPNIIIPYYINTSNDPCKETFAMEY
jgi:hypothetical protein